MLGEFIAYYLGRSVGRNQRPRRRRDLTQNSLGAARAVAILIAFLAFLLVLAALL